MAGWFGKMVEGVLGKWSRDGGLSKKRRDDAMRLAFEHVEAGRAGELVALVGRHPILAKLPLPKEEAWGNQALFWTERSLGRFGGMTLAEAARKLGSFDCLAALTAHAEREQMREQVAPAARGGGGAARL